MSAKLCKIITFIVWIAIVVLCPTMISAGDAQKPAPKPEPYGGVTPVYTDETLQPDPLPCADTEDASSQREWYWAPKCWTDVLDYYTKNNIMPGVAVLFSNPNWGARFARSGKARLDDDSVELLPSTQFRIGSCTKIFIATMMLQLDAEHKINIDDLIGKYLPPETMKLICNGEEITIHECLDMTSGLYSYTNEEYLGDVTEKNAMYDFTQEQILAIAKNKGTSTTDEPGGTDDGENYFYTYTNTGYLVCGLIAERIEGKPLEQILKERIFDKIKITDTFMATDYRVTKRTAHGHTGYKDYEFWIDCTRYNQDVPWAAGAIISTPFDMVQFYQKLLTTEELISVESRAKLLQMNYIGDHQGYGKAILEELLPRGPSYGHGGTALGYLTAVFYYPEEQSFYLQFCNTFDNKYTRAEICYRIQEQIFGACDAPVPVKGAEDVETSNGELTLRWHAGDFYGFKHFVYVGTDADKVRTATKDKHDGVELYTVDNFACPVKNLRSGQTYYWRVDALNKQSDRDYEADEDLVDYNLSYEKTYVFRKPSEFRLFEGPVWHFTVE